MNNATKGFSLIELLVVITLIGVIGVLSTQIFIIGFRSLGRSEAIKEVKQNGDYTMSVVKRMIQESVDIENVSDICNRTYTELNLLNPDGYNTVFICEEDRISSNSAYPNPQPTVGYYLTSAVVKTTSCSFTVVCPTPPIAPKYVSISFQLELAGENLPLEKRVSHIFQSTVSLRSYQ